MNASDSGPGGRSDAKRWGARGPQAGGSLAHSASEADAQSGDGAVVLLAAGEVGVIGAEGLDSAADADVQSHAEEGGVLAPLRAGDGQAAAAGNEGEVGVTAGAVQPVLPRQGGEGPQAQALLEREGLADLDPQGGVERGVAILPDVQVGVARPRLAVALGAAVQEAQPGEGLEGEGLELDAMAHLGEGLSRQAVVVGLGVATARGQADGALALEVVPGEAGAVAQAPVAAAPEAVGGKGVGVDLHPAQAVVDLRAVLLVAERQPHAEVLGEEQLCAEQATPAFGASVGRVAVPVELTGAGIGFHPGRG